MAAGEATLLALVSSLSIAAPMKPSILLSFVVLLMVEVATAQAYMLRTFYEAFKDFASADASHPWDQRHANAPEAVEQFGQLAGLWLVENVSMNRQGVWSAPDTAYWAFKYILDGYGVQDLYFIKRAGVSGGLTQIRVYYPEHDQWAIKYVSYNGDGITQDGEFVAHEENGAMVMNELEQREGANRITFFDMKPDAFQWKTEYYIEQADRWIEVSRISATRMALEDVAAID